MPFRHIEAMVFTERDWPLESVEHDPLWLQLERSGFVTSDLVAIVGLDDYNALLANQKADDA